MQEQLQLLTQTPLLKQKKKENSKKEKRKKEKQKGGEVLKSAPEKVHKRSSSGKSSRLVNVQAFLLCAFCTLPV